VAQFWKQQTLLDALLARDIEPHIATVERGQALAHARVRMRERGVGYQLSPRCRKLIEELFGEGKGLACAAPSAYSCFCEHPAEPSRPAGSGSATLEFARLH
jgi:hypothetical protein